ncbi:uncharacterized protein LOC133521894 [Cydia pomonella]|uniref:uncharacterized protein LOC133521894 n=1 Tax=Cydia pomonella TaxID=82600 RepID=UPI002ADE719E|nr:uncharacterized protein LOC133521894 [Cydia pomonella]
MDEPSAAAKRPSVLTIDRAAFLLLRVKRAFKKKRQLRKDKHAAAAAAAAEALGACRRAPPPLLRSRTLPAIVVPGLSILHAQIDPAKNDLTQSQLLCRGVSSHKVCGLRAQTPRISFTSKDEDAHELRRKSASSRLGSSPRSSIASDEQHGIVLRVPGTTPRGSVSSTGSSRLARLLTQGVRGDELTTDAPRRLSWER